MALVERPGKIFNYDGHFKCPVSDDVIRQAIVDTMAPFGTIIKGSGSSGVLRKSRSANGSLSTITPVLSNPDLSLLPVEEEKPGQGWAIGANPACPDGCP